jgi:peptidoglycan-N-acetylglucosamine deacetylase
VCDAPTMRTRARCTTSWDDGHPLDQRIADLLAKYKLTGTFYVPIANSRPVMNAGQLRPLSEAFEIGAHTVHHVVLTNVSRETADAEIRESKKRLEDLTGRTCETFCFPKGRFYSCHLEMVRRAGFHSARTVELLSTRFPECRAGIYLIPTTIQASPHRWTALAKNSAKRLAARNLFNFAVSVRSRHWTEAARTMLQSVARRGGVFHLWGHSWEIEEQQQWPQLESILRLMQELQSALPCLPNSGLAVLERG